MVDTSGTPVISRVVETLVTPAAISTSVGDSRDDETPENRFFLLRVADGRSAGKIPIPLTV